MVYAALDVNDSALVLLGEKMRHETAAFLEVHLDGEGDAVGKMNYPRRRTRRTEVVWTEGHMGRGSASAEVME